MPTPITPLIPADVPNTHRDIFLAHYNTITHQSSHLFLFAFDQKIEHLDDDFDGNNIDKNTRSLDALFSLAAHTPIGAFATHYGLLTRYGMQYPEIPYIIKLNGKTNLIPTEQHDPFSEQLWSVSDVVTLQKTSKLNICGVGYTIYLGSIYESDMLKQAAQIITQAHQHGLIAILWIYLRGNIIRDETDAQKLAGAAGLAASLGADFVKLKMPHDTSADSLQRIAYAAGNTGVIYAGGNLESIDTVLLNVHTQLQRGARGVAIGRNIFQRPTDEAAACIHAINALVHTNASLSEALNIYTEKKAK